MLARRATAGAAMRHPARASGGGGMSLQAPPEGQGGQRRGAAQPQERSRSPPRMPTAGCPAAGAAAMGQAVASPLQLPAASRSRSRSRSPLVLRLRAPAAAGAAASSVAPASPERGSDDGGADEWLFEEDDECLEFLPAGALVGAAAEAAASPPPRAEPRERHCEPRPLPLPLVAVVPEGGLSAPREVAAVDLLTKAQTEAVQLVVREARLKSRDAETALRARLERWGYGAAKLADVLAYIRDEAPIIIHIDLASRLDRLAKDTHYRNQFETSCTSGSSDLTKRRSWEERLFPGIYSNSEGRDRVKYGVLNAVKDPRGISVVGTQYGKDYLVLQGVRLRTTFSDRDSCNKGQLASCEWYAHVLEKYNDLELKAVVEVALGERLYADSSVLDTAAGGYKEVQIHGDLELAKHIEAVVVHPSHRGSPSDGRIRKWCTSLGVRMVYMPDSAEVPGPVGGESGGSSGSRALGAGVRAGRPAKEAAASAPASGGSDDVSGLWPLWRWHAQGSAGAGLRFDVLSSVALERRHRGDAAAALPSLPAGSVLSVDLVSMSLTAKVDSETVILRLQRCVPAKPAVPKAEPRASRRSDPGERSAAPAVSAPLPPPVAAESGGRRRRLTPVTTAAAAAGAASPAVGLSASSYLTTMMRVATLGYMPLPLPTLSATVVVPPPRAPPAPSSAPRGAAPAARWEWCASACGQRGWKEYAAEVAASLELAHGRGDTALVLSIGGGASYSINLRSMVQMNAATGYARLVRRLPL